MSETIGYPDPGLDLTDGFKPHTSHWGVFSARLGKAGHEVRPYGGDPDPNGIINNFPGALRHHARIAQPAIRRGWLERGPGPDDRRGRDDFVSVSWEQALDLLGGELARVRDTIGPGAVFGVDIGCGWGGMLIYAVQNFGVTAVGNTISRSQYEYARRKVNELDLRGRIEVVCEDYRNLTGKFDKIVSIGMFEHVGKKFIPVFMQKVSQLLEKGGLGLLQTIGKDAPSASDPWVRKYIFPGGYLPTPDEIFREMGKVGFSVLDLENLRLHYARTLDLWVENYERNVEKVRQMFGDAFVRMWRLYLHLSSAGFKYGESRLYQVLFSHGLNNELPMIRDHVYVWGPV